MAATNIYSKKSDKIGKKVCFVSSYVYPLFNPRCKVTFGGAEVQMYIISKELAKDKNFDVHFIIGDFNQKPIEKYGKIKVYKILQTRKNIMNYIKTPLGLYYSLKKINPDVVIQRAAGYETGICAFFCQTQRKKFIYSIAHKIDVSGEYASKGIAGMLYNYGISRADFIIAQSRDQVKLLNKWKGKKIRKVSVIKSSYEIKGSPIKNKKFVLWVGRSDKWKKPEIFLTLAKEFPKEEFVMIMPKSPSKKTWNKIYEESKKIKNLKFIEKVPFKEIRDYFDRAKIFINTSKYEGFPNTFIQSCIASTPILSLKVDPDGFINKNDCGFSCNGNLNLLKEKLKTILNNQRTFKEMSKKAFKYAQKNHNIKHNIKEWKKILCSLSSDVD